MRSWPMLKCSSERCVCAPHSLSAGTSTTPILSVSLRTSVIAPLSQIKQTWANFLIGLLPRVDLWHGNIETVQGDGHHAIQPDEIDELCGSFLAKCRYRLSRSALAGRRPRRGPKQHHKPPLPHASGRSGAGRQRSSRSCHPAGRETLRQERARRSRRPSGTSRLLRESLSPELVAAIWATWT